VIWIAGFFGKNAIDEDAVDMLGSLPVDRALSILTNIEETMHCIRKRGFKH